MGIGVHNSIHRTLKGKILVLPRLRLPRPAKQLRKMQRINRGGEVGSRSRATKDVRDVLVKHPTVGRQRNFALSFRGVSGLLR